MAVHKARRIGRFSLNCGGASISTAKSAAA